MVDLNKAMYDVLVVGMILSTVTYVAGLILFFLQSKGPPDVRFVHYSSVAMFLQDLRQLRSGAVLILGTIILVATPVTRVFVSIWVFAVNRDKKFVLVTAAVFLILAVSILLGYVWNFTPK